MKNKGKSTSQHSQQSHQPRQAEEGAAAGTELFDQAMKSYEQALRTGVKLQEDTTRWWSNFMNQSAWPQELQRQVSSVMSQAIPTAQRNMEESLRLIDQTSRTGLNLLKRTMDGTRSNPASEAQSQVQELWQSSMNVMQSNLQSITQSQARVMESWAEFMRRGVVSTTSAAASAASAASGTAK
ncbi:MAG: hypothetical protein JWQ71_3953 [Pedosphaera sp.]|nr:hypothetical protein [Pedosphaera sp.]